jgi:hypothetical protein
MQKHNKNMIRIISLLNKVNHTSPESRIPTPLFDETIQDPFLLLIFEELIKKIVN